MGKRKYAPPGATCPGCDLDVAGFTLGTDSESRRTYTAPASSHLENDGRTTYKGGLTHTEGGMRCHR